MLVGFLLGVWVGTGSVLGVTASAGIGYVLFLRRTIHWRYVGWFMLALLCGAVRYEWALLDHPRMAVAQFENHKALIVGRVISDPEVGIDQQQFIISGIIDDPDRSAPLHLQVRTGLYPRVHYHDTIKLTCTITIPEPTPDFDYAAYLAVLGVGGVCKQPAILLLESADNAWSPGKILLAIKHTARDVLYRAMPEPYASVAYALNFGPRAGIPDTLYEAFRITGTTHLIAISGSNMAIIIGLLAALSTHLFIPRRKAFWLITAALIGYVFIIGFPASAVRAAIMGWSMLWAQYLGRQSRPVTVLLCTASCMVVANPFILRDDLGFQLSFLAVMGLGVFTQPLNTYLRWIPAFGGIREAISMTLAAQATTTPLLIFKFGAVSVISPLVNTLVVPVLAYAVIMSMPLILLAWIFSWYAHVLVLPLTALMMYQTALISWFGAVPWAYVAI